MRKTIPSDTEAQLLHLSRRRCCLCFGLLGEFGVKKGQLAHLDHDPSNNNIDNLAFLCLEHHDEYDTTPSQSKGLKRKEVIIHRESLYAAVRQFLDAKPLGAEQQPALDSPLSSTGELDYYLATFTSAQSAGILVMTRIRVGNKNLMEGLAAADATARDEIERGRASSAGFRRYNASLASTLTRFSQTLTRETEELAVATTRMLDALSRAAAVSSDIDIAETDIFEEKLDQLHAYRGTLAEASRNALLIVQSVRDLGRRTTEFNKGRRLAVAAFEAFAEMVERQHAELDRHESHLRKAMALL